MELSVLIAILCQSYPYTSPSGAIMSVNSSEARQKSVACYLRVSKCAEGLHRKLEQCLLEGVNRG